MQILLSGDGAGDMPYPETKRPTGWAGRIADLNLSLLCEESNTQHYTPAQTHDGPPVKAGHNADFESDAPGEGAT